MSSRLDTLYRDMLQAIDELSEAAKIFKGFGHPALAKLYEDAAASHRAVIREVEAREPD